MDRKFTNRAAKGFNLYTSTIKLFVALSFFIMINACVPQIPLETPEDKVFEENLLYTKYTPEIANLQLPNNVMVQVEPVEPTHLNEVTYLAAVQTGDTERWSFQRIRNLQSSEELDARDRQKIEQLSNVSEQLNEEYADILSDELIEDVLVAHAEQLNINLPENNQDSVLENSDYPNNYNPYYVNGRFLSTIKLTYFNKGSEVQRLRNDEFSVIYDGNTLSPHDHEYFDRRLQNPRQIDNVFNFNMPEELTLGPNQTISRYIGVQPMSNNINTFSVQYVNGDTFESTEFEIERVNEKLEHVFKGFVINDRGEMPSNIRLYNRNYILINDGRVQLISQKEFYIREDFVAIESNICGFFHKKPTTIRSSGGNSAATHSTSTGGSSTSAPMTMVECITVDLSEAPEQIVDFSFN